MIKKNTKLLVDKICSDIIPNNSEYTRKGFTIYLNKNHLDLTYKEKKYIIYVIRKKHLNYWYIKSFNYYRFITTATRNFDYIINIIKNNSSKICTKRKLINRKKDLYKLIANSNFFNKKILLDIINDDCLNNIIIRINNIPTTDTNCTCLIEKGYMTGDEQFISLLNFLIIRITEHFNFLKINKLKLISCIIYNNRNYHFLLSKKYIGNNDNIPYFQYYIKKFIIDGFTENAIELIEESTIIKNFFRKEKIVLSNKIQTTNEIQKIMLLLQSLAYSNKENPEVMLLFKNMNHLNLKTTDRFQLRNYYKHAWENIINTYVVQKKEEEIQINNFDL